jgi:hypothetical protein
VSGAAVPNVTATVVIHAAGPTPLSLREAAAAALE